MSNILFIVEGKVDEPKYMEQFIKYHQECMIKNGNSVIPIIVQSYGTLIYDLYKKSLRVRKRMNLKRFLFY